MPKINNIITVNMNDKLENLKLHFFYCAVILNLIIIAIATDRWTLQPKFTEFLSNAATMTSLVLGLVAIFYSFIANDGLSKSLGSIGIVSEEIKSSKEKITQQVAAGAETTKAAERSAVLIDAASTSIGLSLTSLSATLAAIQTHTEVLHGSLVGLPTRLDQLETKVIDATRSLGQKPVQLPIINEEKVIDSSIVESFLRKSALSINILTYACVLAKENKKELKFSEFCIAINSKLENYYFGAFSCMDSINLLNSTINAEEERTYTIDKIHPYLVENTKSYIIGFLDRNFKEKHAKTYERWIGAMENVENLLK
ncbi:hypothetical protein [Janthinobacterium sp. GMG1]|uniref:hypothetical protein n=1 Tax=Janthinobacterium sp. GMG1 TaxID=3096007 RepID=UPI002ACA3FFB|nr:hypothetical protein [Janthinobacterium sp. GMG1]MDZ5634462.1 hypothetical protein [Janthinobacterium sp. GMG1]